MASIGHIGVLRRIWEFQGIPDPPNRTHRVPYSHKVQWAMAAECCLEPICHLKGVRHPAGLSRSPGVEPKYIWDQAVIPGLEKSEHVKQAGECPRRVCAPAKTKQKNSVADFEDIHQITVGIADVGQQSYSEREAHHHRPSLADPVVRCWCAHRAHARVVVTNLLFAIDGQGTVELDHVRVVITKFVPCSVTAHDYVLGHGDS